ncbi:MAG: methyltransferase domain-containing protein [Deltaproteobacteria bacterium]|nr:methyltransferase domain-containing protein [Deltaproteobacteria bacterium]
MPSIDKAFVRKSFNASAETYDRHAGLQQRLLQQLLGFMGGAPAGVARVLDVGMGTGNLSGRLAELFPAAEVYGCDIADQMILYARSKLRSSGRLLCCTAADAEALPFAAGSFDLVVSSFTYQWLESWDRALAEAVRVLKPGGVFAFAAFGQATFYELKQAYRKACYDTGYHGGEALRLALTEEAMRMTLVRAGYDAPETSAFRMVETYQSVKHLVRTIKGMGARNASRQRNKNLGVRKVWQRMAAYYAAEFGSEEGIPATYEVIMGKGVKSRS